MVNNISESPNNQPVDTQNNSNSTKLLDPAGKFLPHIQHVAAAMTETAPNEWNTVQKNIHQSNPNDYNKDQQEDTLRKLEEQTRQRVDDMLQH